jgi:hypothetical protein
MKFIVVHDTKPWLLVRQNIMAEGACDRGDY